jgi:hypothetical protein
MTHSVIITTPMPTLDEIGKELGLTRAEQDYLIRLVDNKVSGKSESASAKLRHTSSRTSSFKTRKRAAPARKTASRANASN